MDEHEYDGEDFLSSSRNMVIIVAERIIRGGEIFLVSERLRVTESPLLWAMW